MLSAVQTFFSKSWYYFSSNKNFELENRKSIMSNIPSEGKTSWYNKLFYFTHKLNEAPTINNNPDKSGFIIKFWEKYFTTSLPELPPVIEPSLIKRAINYIVPPTVEKVVENPENTNEKPTIPTAVAVSALITLFLSSVATVYFARARAALNKRNLANLNQAPVAEDEVEVASNIEDHMHEDEGARDIEDRISVLSERDLTRYLTSLTPDEELMYEENLPASLTRSTSLEDVPTVINSSEKNLVARSNSLAE